MNNKQYKEHYLHIPVLTSLLRHFLIKQKTDVRMKIIPREIFFFIVCSVKPLQPTTAYQYINECSQT